MQNVLVAGGAGYLGSVLVRRLLQSGHRVRVLDRCFFGTESLDEFARNPRFELIRGDVRWPAPEVFREVDVLCDLAGLSNDPSCALDPELTWAINRDGAFKLARMAKGQGVSRIVYASSCSVYGEGQGLALDEQSPCHPVSLYAQSKRMVEEVLLGEIHDEQTSVTILRNGTLYGLSPRMRFDLIVNVMTARAHQEGKIFVNGGGEQWRPLLHVDDAARAMAVVMGEPREKVGGEIFNVGGDAQNLRVITVANLVRDAFPEAQLIVVPEDPDRRSYHVSFDKIRQGLGYEVQHHVGDSIGAIREALRSGQVAFGGSKDAAVVTTQRYVELTRADPLLDEAQKFELHRRVEFYKHSLTPQDELAVQQVLRSLFLTTGSVVRRFEESFARFLEVPHVVGTTSCTESLFLALRALGVGPGDEVITTAMTFVATANAIEHLGAKPVFVDVEPLTGNLSVEAAAAAITGRTRAVVPVHLYGQMCDMRALAEVARDRGLKVVEDAAHCVEGSRDGVRPGALGHAACFSFYATKNVTCGEGGAIATRDGELADRLRKLRLHGLEADAASRYGKRCRPPDMLTLGYKANMSNIDAALLIHQLERVEELWQRREQIARRYEGAFAALQAVEFPQVLDGSRSARHLFPIWVSAGVRDTVLDRLQDAGVGVAVNYRPVHLMSYYRDKYGATVGDCPVAEQIGERTLSLPLYPRLSDREVEYVIEAVGRALVEPAGGEG